MTSTYSRDNLASLPADDDDLTTAFASPADYNAVASNDGTTVDQSGSEGYALFEWKETATGNSGTFTWKGESTKAPSESKVQIQIYKRTGTGAPVWEDVPGASDNSTAADTNFTIGPATVSPLDDYKAVGTNEVALRTWQADSGAPTLVWQSLVTGGTPWNWDSVTAGYAAESSDYAPPNSLRFYNASTTNVVAAKALTTMQNIAIEFPILIHSFSAVDCIVWGNNVSADSCITIRLRNDGGTLYIYCGLRDSIGWNWIDNATQVLPFDAWKTVRVEVNGGPTTSTLKLFVNGVQGTDTLVAGDMSSLYFQNIDVVYNVVGSDFYIGPVSVYNLG